ncbi:MrcB family domain-containing protein [Sphingosinicella microcystinivorans]|uniref:HNH endonuclease n=1 Tax=Sphingosinicella microcystinivorans TaxID=335406 RepID=A0AAD1D6U3_SPHMI|nr:DUF3578 domain-containing protein [Sphingosinicella microcystinivorans]RKS91821.1 HNH endonuclease [Sphingosinicella microcystinivorans]BBE34805.1 hypothetical protein SmB9_24630 [Sphingosinicella microcystinivorans]
MAELDENGRKLLRLLVDLLPDANPDRPDRMIGYKGTHERLGLQNLRGDWGDSLKIQGLNNLAEWTKSAKKPAITGIIVNQNDNSPGKGYFSLFGRPDADWPWWREQVLSSKKYDWTPFLSDHQTPVEIEDPAHRLFGLILNEYKAATKQPFATHSIADMVRTELPQAISNWLHDSERYLVRGSSGQGTWANVPWVAVMDRLITETVQGGYYLVYLFRADLEGVYLSLNQGVTTIKEQYGSGSTQALKARAQDFLSRLGNLVGSLATGPIDLGEARQSSLGSLYEAGSVCSIFYPTKELPAAEVLRDDFGRFARLYLELSARDDRLFSSADAEDDEQESDAEDARTLREHKRIERNRRLAKKAKTIHGYACKACGFDFAKKYGKIGEGFIEAHHLLPLAKLKGQKVPLNAKKDFTVLCSNCHRMIHKTEMVGDVVNFRINHLSQTEKPE